MHTEKNTSLHTALSLMVMGQYHVDYLVEYMMYCQNVNSVVTPLHQTRQAQSEYSQHEMNMTINVLYLYTYDYFGGELMVTINSCLASKCIGIRTKMHKMYIRLAHIQCGKSCIHKLNKTVTWKHYIKPLLIIYVCIYICMYIYMLTES